MARRNWGKFKFYKVSSLILYLILLQAQSWRVMLRFPENIFLCTSSATGDP